MNKTTSKPQAASAADDLVKPVSRELKPSELDRVNAGKVTMSDFHFTKKVDKASPGN